MNKIPEMKNVFRINESDSEDRKKMPDPFDLGARSSDKKKDSHSDKKVQDIVRDISSRYADYVGPTTESRDLILALCDQFGFDKNTLNKVSQIIDNFMAD